MSLLNAGPVGRPRLQKGQAGIDRPCTTEYRPSQDVTTDHRVDSGLFDRVNFKFLTKGFLNLSHPIFIPFPETVEANEVNQIHEQLLDECISNNPINPNNSDQMKISPDEGRVLPVLMEKKPRGNPSTPVGRRKKNSNKVDYHDSNESKSNITDYCVFGTLLFTCLIILLLW